MNVIKCAVLIQALEKMNRQTNKLNKTTCKLNTGTVSEWLFSSWNSNGQYLSLSCVNFLQAILMSLCLQSIVDEILKIKQGNPVKKVGDLWPWPVSNVLWPTLTYVLCLVQVICNIYSVFCLLPCDLWPLSCDVFLVSCGLWAVSSVLLPMNLVPRPVEAVTFFLDLVTSMTCVLWESPLVNSFVHGHVYFFQPKDRAKMKKEATPGFERNNSVTSDASTEV